MGSKPDVIGEMAHVIGYKKGAARGCAKRQYDNSYDNLILLCPTCHTKVDKAPKHFSVKTLKSKKREWEDKVARKLDGKVYKNLRPLCRAISKILIENYVIWKEYGPESNMSIYGYNYENYYRSGREDKYDRIEPKLIDKFFSGDFGKLSGKSLEKSKRNFENEEGDMLGIYDINGDSDDDIIIYYKSDSDILYILSREDFSYPENAWSMGEEYYRTHNRYVSEEEREDDKARVAQLKKEYEEEKAKKEAKGEEFKEYDVEKKYYESKYIAPVKYTEPGNVLLPIQKEEIRNWYPEKPKGLRIPSNTEITKLAQEQAKKEIMEQLQAGEFGDPKKIDKTKIKELLEGRL